MYRRVLEFFNRHSWIDYFAMAAFGLIFFGALEWSRIFADPDSFYHAKMASLMLKQGVVKNFPWLVFTDLPQIYTDHHFLYHLLLIPFVWKINPLVGIKIATVLINTAFVVLF